MRAHLCLRSLWNHRKSNEQVKISKCHKRNKNHCLYKTWWWWYHKRENEKNESDSLVSWPERLFEILWYRELLQMFFFIKTRQFYVTTWLLNFHCSHVPQSSFRPSQNSYCFLYENIMHIKINFPQQKKFTSSPCGLTLATIYFHNKMQTTRTKVNTKHDKVIISCI